MPKIDAREKLSKADLSAEVFGQDEAMAKISIGLLDSEADRMSVLSDFFPEEIPYVSAYLTVADKFHLTMMKEFVVNFMRLRVSKDRLGRRELVGIASGVSGEKKEKFKLSSLFSGLRG